MGKRLTQEEFIERCLKVHKNKYDLSKTIYKNMQSKIEVICKMHGVFLIAPQHFLEGTMCSFCNKERLRTLRSKNVIQFKTEANAMHREKYDYKHSVYKNNNIKLKILCPDHGIFEQTPANHLRGHGCLLCSKMKKSKKECNLAAWLSAYTSVDQNYKPSWLGRKEIDIYLPEYDIGVEYNGLIYHHSTLNTTSYYKRFTKNQNYHKNKYDLCLENNVDLIHIFEFEDIEEWKQKILNYFSNPSDFTITFTNERRSYCHDNIPLTFYGISKILHGDLVE